MVEIFFFYKKKIAFAAPAFLSKEWAPGWRHPLFPNRATFGSQDLCTSGLCARAPAGHITHRSGRLKAFKVIAMPMSCPELRSWGCSARTHFRVQDQAWGKLCSTYPGATANAPKRACWPLLCPRNCLTCTWCRSEFEGRGCLYFLGTCALLSISHIFRPLNHFIMKTHTSQTYFF